MVTLRITYMNTAGGSSCRGKYRGFGLGKWTFEMQKNASLTFGFLAQPITLDENNVCRVHL